VIRTGGLDRGRVHTIYGGTDTEVFNPKVDRGVLRRELGVDHTHLLIGQVSVRDWKGWSDLVAAFFEIAPRHPLVRLLLVVCEPESGRAKVCHAARRLGIGDLLLTLPYRTDMPEILAACDVVVDASWSGTGITGTIREAMATGRAVVATDCGGNAELVIDGEVGLLVPPQDVDALAGALSRLLDDPVLRQRLGAAARRRVVEQFSAERRTHQLEALYRSVLADECDAGRC
jgi:glycosyltransferase involved in cell wall biosynthesis